MASIRVLMIVAICLMTVIASAADSNLHFDDLLSCKDSCDKYAFHSGGNGDTWECCTRGCRFFSILSFLHDRSDTNSTVASCTANCDEAYSRQADRQACQWGCRSHQHTPESAKEDSQQGEEEVAMAHMLYPLLYMHSVYSNMLLKVHRHIELRWSIFTQPNSGELVVIRSQPRFIEFAAVTDMDDTGVDHKTSANLETNIVSRDNSATPLLNVRPSQIRAAHSTNEDGQGLQLDADGNAVAGRLDWWTCVIKKTDLVRIVLCFLIILVLAIIMMWIGLSAAPSAPEQNLSINGDLEYLRSMTQKDGFQLLHPQDRVEARPLPIKIRVERI